MSKYNIDNDNAGLAQPLHIVALFWWRLHQRTSAVSTAAGCL